jgi:predicted phosphodiesterase
MRFLCISDIHGNEDALDRILKEGDALGFDQLIVCGDLCYPGKGALNVWKKLVERKALCVQGVGDRALANVDPDALPTTTPEGEAKVQRLREVKTELGELILARLAKLPPMARLPLESGHTMIVVHGSPGDPTEALTRDMSEEELLARMGDEPGDLVICGSSHEQFDGFVADVRIASVGSVGEEPGGQHALGAIVESNQGGFDVIMLAVPLEGEWELGTGEAVASPPEDQGHGPDDFDREKED